jgi:predicted transposase YbfD/YdcC
MLFTALLAMLCGAKYSTDIEVFGRAKEGLLRTVLGLKNGIPSHDTFSRLFRLLDPKSLEKGFRRFTAAFAETVKIDGVIALDGKALRRAYECGKSHMLPVMVTAWAAKTRLALANVLSPGNNEAAGALQLIEMLQLKGCVVTMDALHCRRDTARAIVGARWRLCAGGERQRARSSERRQGDHCRSGAKKDQAGRHDRCRSWPQRGACSHGCPGWRENFTICPIAWAFEPRAERSGASPTSPPILAMRGALPGIPEDQRRASGNGGREQCIEMLFFVATAVSSAVFTPLAALPSGLPPTRNTG